jgi:integrase/recombinase XerD
MKTPALTFAVPAAYLKNGGKLEIAQRIAAHESSRNTGLYDRRDDDVNLDEVEKIRI